MSHEIIFTSVSQGLDNAAGYCAVAEDAGIPLVLRKHLETLNVYHHLTGHEAQHSPVAYSHLVVSEDGIALPGSPSYSVLSRIAPAGTDYLRQPNQLAHHIILNENEKVPEGPAWLCALPAFHLTEWITPSVRFVQGRLIPSLTSPPSLTRRQFIARQQRYLDPQKMLFSEELVDREQFRMFLKEIDDQILMSKPPSSPCPAWKKATGDAGWGGLLADTVRSAQPAVVLFRPGQNILPLFVEAIALLPTELRWSATFCTYTAERFPKSVVCQWLGVLAGSPLANKLRQDSRQLVIDLTVPPGPIPYGQYVEFARSGADRDLPENEDQTKPIETMERTQTPQNTKTVPQKEEPDKPDSTAVPVPPPVPFHLTEGKKIVIQPRSSAPKNGLLNSILTMKGRGQFYLLYGTTLLLVLFLLLLVIDQAGNFGIVRNFINGNPRKIQKTKKNEPPALNKPSVFDELPPALNEPPVPNEPPMSVGGNSSPVSEQDKKELENYLAQQKYPEALPMSVPSVDSAVKDSLQVNPPETAVFSELAGLFPHTAALELNFIPLIEIPKSKVETRKEPNSWTTVAVDSDTQVETPMFRFTLTEQGLSVDWDIEGMDSQHRYDTILLSLGFLNISVTQKPDTVKTIPLFVPKKGALLKIQELGEKKELPLENPFAVEPWKSVLAEPRFVGLFSFQLEAKVVSLKERDSTKPVFSGIKRIEYPETELSRFVAVFEFENDYRKLKESGYEFIPVTLEIEGAAGTEKLDWKDRYEEQVRKWNEELEEVKGNLTEKQRELVTVKKQAVSGGTQELQQQRDTLGTETQLLNDRIKELEDLLNKAEPAHKKIIENPDIGLEYKVYLIPVQNEGNGQKLLIMKSE